MGGGGVGRGGLLGVPLHPLAALVVLEVAHLPAAALLHRLGETREGPRITRNFPAGQPSPVQLQEGVTQARRAVAEE